MIVSIQVKDFAFFFTLLILSIYDYGVLDVKWCEDIISFRRVIIL